MPEEIPDKQANEVYVLECGKYRFNKSEILLSTGEIVMGTPCSMKSTVDWLVKEEGGGHLGVGVEHR